MMRIMRYFKLTQWLVLPAIAAFLIGVQPAASQTSSFGGDTIYDVGCMQDIAGFTLNCNANDIKIAGVAKNADGTDKINITDPCEFPGDEVTFEATFAILSSASRYDIGIYFATDGDLNNNGAVSGKCSISTLPYAPFPDYLDLDGINKNGIQDLCGDVNRLPNTQPYYFHTIKVTTTCVDSDGDGNLNLPYCLSWRTSGNNELCRTPTDAYPGTPSKCNCDKGFNVPVPVPKAGITVTKTADKDKVNEPGEPVKFTVSIKNTGIDPNNPVTIDTLEDDVYGNLLDPNNEWVPKETNFCLDLDTEIGSNETVSCTFEAWVKEDMDKVEIDETTGRRFVTNTVAAEGFDSRVPPNPVAGSDDWTVEILDLKPTIEVTKTVDPATLPEPGGDFTYKVTVKNTSPGDAVTITSLIDDKDSSGSSPIYLIEQGFCSMTEPTGFPVDSPVEPNPVLEMNETLYCLFKVEFTGGANDSKTNTVKAIGYDDEGNKAEFEARETVNLTNVDAPIRLDKKANPDFVDEPGGKVNYIFTVYNDSEFESVEFFKLEDKVGDITTDLTAACINPDDGKPFMPITIGPGKSFSCTIPMDVEGTVEEYVKNLATVYGTDDGEELWATDDAQVLIKDVPPEAEVTKTVTEMYVVYKVEVKNLSTAEPLDFILGDDKFGDITNIHEADDTYGEVKSTDCKNGSIAKGETYSCTFIGTVTTSPHTNEVTATITDDEENKIKRSGSVQVTFGPPTTP